jgi:hypothetical protein
MLVFVGSYQYTQASYKAIHESHTLDHQVVASHAQFENLREHSATWRDDGHGRYQVTADECSTGLAHVFLQENSTLDLIVDSSNTLMSNTSTNSAVFYLPQAGWCP